jgi:hypothetical protein
MYIVHIDKNPLIYMIKYAISNSSVLLQSSPAKTVIKSRSKYAVPSETDDFVEDEYDGRSEHEGVELGRLGDAGQPVHQVQQVQQDVQLQHQRA